MDIPPMGGEVASMSALSGSVNSAEMRDTTGIFIPNVPTELKPTTGMTFTSLEEAFDSRLQHMFQIRHQWIPAYTDRIFSAGMRTTGRSESINAFFDGFVNHRSSLMDFANGYAKALERRRECEEEADFQSSYGKPVLKTRYDIEASMAELYTFNVFLIFQKEVEESVYYMAERVGVEGALHHWQVFHYDDHTRRKCRHISWNVDELLASCSCLKFESSGILCWHILTLFRFMEVPSIPQTHVLSRWKKMAKDQFKHDYTSGGGTAAQSLAVREHGYARWVASLRHQATSSPNAFDVFIAHMEKLAAALAALQPLREIEGRRMEGEEAIDQPTTAAGDNFEILGDGIVNVAIHFDSGTLASQSSQAHHILDPHIVKTKERTTKRFKGPLEHPRGVAKLCRGCNERVVAQRGA